MVLCGYPYNQRLNVVADFTPDISIIDQPSEPGNQSQKKVFFDLDFDVWNSRACENWKITPPPSLLHPPSQRIDRIGALGRKHLEAGLLPAATRPNQVRSIRNKTRLSFAPIAFNIDRRHRQLSLYNEKRCTNKYPFSLRQPRHSLCTFSNCVLSTLVSYLHEQCVCLFLRPNQQGINSQPSQLRRTNFSSWALNLSTFGHLWCYVDAPN